MIEELTEHGVAKEAEARFRWPIFLATLPPIGYLWWSLGFGEGPIGGLWGMPLIVGAGQACRFLSSGRGWSWDDRPLLILLATLLSYTSGLFVVELAIGAAGFPIHFRHGIWGPIHEGRGIVDFEMRWLRFALNTGYYVLALGLAGMPLPQAAAKAAATGRSR